MRVTLNGIVAADDDVEIYQWYGFAAFSPKAVRDAVASTPEGEELVLEINSGGGSVFAGSEIYSVLRSSGIHTVAEVQSLAASAASYMCLACDEVRISPVAQMMLHLPSTYTEGNRTAHMQSIQMLDSTREAILNAYELKAGGKADRAEFRRMMNAETWLTAQEAVDCGLIERVGSLGDALDCLHWLIERNQRTGGRHHRRNGQYCPAERDERHRQRHPGTGMRRDAGHHGAAGQIHGGASPHAGDGPGTHSINGR